jgi:CBS domain-containing protein
MDRKNSEFDDAYDDPIPDPRTLSEETLNEPIRLLDPREAVFVGAGASVADAISAMSEHANGCVLVVDAGNLVGILTDRDVVRRVLPLGVPLGAVRVADHMTATPDVLTMDDPIAFALNRMAIGSYRHVPLLDADGRPVAVVSVRDIVRFIVDHFSRKVMNLPPSHSPSTPPTASDYPPHGTG